MSRFGKNSETESKVAHNERLEFLGDAVVEFVTSVHLFHMFPDLEEGGLATYRAALVQNQHLVSINSEIFVWTATTRFYIFLSFLTSCCLLKTSSDISLVCFRPFWPKRWALSTTCCTRMDLTCATMPKCVTRWPTVSRL